MNNFIRMILLLVTACFFHQSALGQSRSTQIMTGEGNGRPEFNGPVHSLYTQKDAAKAFCTRHTQSGDVVGDYYIHLISDKSGGWCGWSVWKIE